jgi:glycosyltransferase involved in cell wall biosynthesis
MARIIHCTSVHRRYDTRIFLKMCKSSVRMGYDVHLLVSDGQGHEFLDGVSITDVGMVSGRFFRMLFVPSRILQRAINLKADLYHLHDPELIPIGLRLKRLGFRVIFDSHEDVPKQLQSKPYISRIWRTLLPKIYSYYEKWACNKLNGIISATPEIHNKFSKINSNCININNFPLQDELATDSSRHQKCREICYVGSIGRIRGIREICSAMENLQTDTRLNLVGAFQDPIVKMQLEAMNGWNRINFFGYRNRTFVRKILQRSVAGLVIFHPLPNHVSALPNKIFEYMSAGVPVIASDFPLWREIIEGSRCGILVDPNDLLSISNAIDLLISNPQIVTEMGNNGRRAVREKYNWGNEEKSLYSFYKRVLEI